MIIFKTGQERVPVVVRACAGLWALPWTVRIVLTHNTSNTKCMGVFLHSNHLLICLYLDVE